MLEPSKKDGRVIQQLPLKTTSTLNQMAYSAIKDVRKFTLNLVGNIFDTNNPEYLYRLIELKLQKKYGEMYTGFKPQLVDLANTSNLYNKYLVEQTVGAIVAWKKVKPYKVLPNTKPYEITNRVLSNKAISIRTKTQANRVTNIIKDSVNKGRSIQKTKQLLDIEFGWRTKDGKLSHKMLDLMSQGKQTFTNGHFYDSYRIARTESMRMLDIQALDIYEQVPDDTKRLKLLAVLDTRTREQSRVMNGQISRKDGKFKYPNGVYYHLGTQPVQWAANDRETTLIVFKRNNKGDLSYKDFNQFKTDRLDSLYI